MQVRPMTWLCNLSNGIVLRISKMHTRAIRSDTNSYLDLKSTPWEACCGRPLARSVVCGFGDVIGEPYAQSSCMRS